MNKIKMIYYDRIDVSEGIDIGKTSTSKECDICHVSEGTDINKTSTSKESDICQYWYFLNKLFKFQPYVCNRCHDLLILSMNLSNTAILNIKGSDYCCVSISEAIKLLQNVDSTKKNGTL